MEAQEQLVTGGSTEELCQVKTGAEPRQVKTAAEPGPVETGYLPDVSYLPEPIRTQFQWLLQSYEDVFSKSAEEVGAYTGPHQLIIDTGAAQPVKQRAFRTPLHLREQLQTQLHQLEERVTSSPPRHRGRHRCPEKLPNAFRRMSFCR